LSFATRHTDFSDSWGILECLTIVSQFQISFVPCSFISRAKAIIFVNSEEEFRLLLAALPEREQLMGMI
jgi:hypothetical protein